MTIGIGCDLVELARIERFYHRHPRMVDKILHPQERVIWQTYVDKNQMRRAHAFLAKRFAAKEAIAKALGLGMRAPMAWQHVAVLNDDTGKPVVHTYGDLAIYLSAHAYAILVSLSDERHYAMALAHLLATTTS